MRAVASFSQPCHSAPGLQSLAALDVMLVQALLLKRRISLLLDDRTACENPHARAVCTPHELGGDSHAFISEGQDQTRQVASVSRIAEGIYRSLAQRRALRKVLTVGLHVVCSNQQIVCPSKNSPSQGKRCSLPGLDCTGNCLHTVRGATLFRLWPATPRPLRGGDNSQSAWLGKTKAGCCCSSPSPLRGCDSRRSPESQVKGTRKKTASA